MSGGGRLKRRMGENPRWRIAGWGNTPKLKSGRIRRKLAQTNINQQFKIISERWHAACEKVAIAKIENNKIETKRHETT